MNEIIERLNICLLLKMQNSNDIIKEYSITNNLLENIKKISENKYKLLLIFFDNLSKQNKKELNESHMAIHQTNEGSNIFISSGEQKINLENTYLDDLYDLFNIDKNVKDFIFLSDILNSSPGSNYKCKIDNFIIQMNNKDKNSCKKIINEIKEDNNKSKVIKKSKKVIYVNNQNKKSFEKQNNNNKSKNNSVNESNRKHLLENLKKNSIKNKLKMLNCFDIDSDFKLIYDNLDKEDLNLPSLDELINYFSDFNWFNLLEIDTSIFYDENTFKLLMNNEHINNFKSEEYELLCLTNNALPKYPKYFYKYLQN